MTARATKVVMVWIVTSMMGGIAGGLAFPGMAQAASSGMGDWVQVDPKGKPTGLTLTAEKWGRNGAKLTWHLGKVNMMMTLDSKMDGKDAPLLVNGKPSGETMALSWIDDHHVSGIVKMNGKPFGTSQATLSDDFNKMTVENDFHQPLPPGQPSGKTTEIWVRK